MTIGKLIKNLVKFPAETEINISADYWGLDYTDRAKKILNLRIDDKIDLVIKAEYHKECDYLVPKGKAELEISKVTKDKEKSKK